MYLFIESDAYSSCWAQGERPWWKSPLYTKAHVIVDSVKQQKLHPMRWSVVFGVLFK